MSKLVTIRSQSRPQQWRSVEDFDGSLDTAALAERESPNGALAAAADVSRRGFMGVSGVTLAAAASALSGCIRKPQEQILPLTNRPEDYIPGKPVYFATGARIGGAALGLLATSQDGRPTKVDGNPATPSSLGGSNAWAQASIMDLYDPDRLRAPRHAGAEVAWADWDAFVQKRAGELASTGGRGVAVLMAETSSPTVVRLLAELKERWPQAGFFHADNTARVQEAAGADLVGRAGQRPVYHLTQAQVILALDSDFLGVEGNSVRLAREFAATRRVESVDAGMSRLYVVEPGFSNTGMQADNRLRLPASQVRNFLIALAKAIFAAGVAEPSPGIASALRPGPMGPTDEAWVAAVARDLVAAGGRSVVLVGERQPASVHALGLLVNAALGAVGQGVTFAPRVDLPGAGSIADLAKQAGFLETLIILGGNPVDRLPGTLKFADLMGKVPESIYLTSAGDATASKATWAVPASHFLESWGDIADETAVVSIAQPLVAPLFEHTRSPIQFLGELAGHAPDGRALVQATWSLEGGFNFEASWRKWLHAGLVEGTGGGADGAFVWPSAAELVGTAHTPAGPSPIEVDYVLDYSVLDGRYVNNPWLQELPDPITKLTWDNAALMSPATARSISVESGDVVDLEVDGRSVQIPAWVVPGIADNVVILPLGYGEAESGRYSRSDVFFWADHRVCGVNVNPLRSHEHPWFQVGVDLRKGRGKVELASTQHHDRMDPGFGYPARPLVRENTLAEFHEDPEFVKGFELLPESALKSLWTEPNERGGQQWGMTIDLNTCTGCSACAIACQAENNIQVVGRDQVARGREMSWIRIDRYFTGDPERPEMVVQPIACAHCETAPCEGVCPVAATAHGPEGLNDIAYNRCIGTRYCANNCPYKVRRYNFRAYAGENHEANDLLDLQQNPDVTVRFRGVVEKCSYCVQRINGAKIAAKRSGARTVADGAITPACAQACPAEAITFGDINDPKSKVARLKRNPRNYGLLAELNIHPRTTFLARVRNPNPELA